MTYEIRYEPVNGNPKYNIYYTGGEYDGLKEFHSTDGINGTIRDGYKLPNAPNWLGLEQNLVYSALYGKAISDSDAKWFSVLQTTLQNGKRGEASENFLLYALSNLGVTWTTQEKADLNQILTNNNFSIQIA